MWLSAASKAEAERLRDAEVKKLAKGIVRTEQTVGGYVAQWLATVEVGPGTWPRYQAHFTERIEPAFGHVALDRLTPQDVRSGMLRWSGSPATRGGALRLLRAAMKQAVADRRIEHDPTAGIPYPRVARKDPVTLDSEQARRLIATVKGERFAPILIVSLGLGVRRGEALGLRTVDVDLDAGSVTIAKGLRYIPPTLRAPGEGPYRANGWPSGTSSSAPPRCGPPTTSCSAHPWGTRCRFRPSMRGSRARSSGQGCRTCAGTSCERPPSPCSWTWAWTC
jgi:hypothetical protein